MKQLLSTMRKSQKELEERKLSHKIANQANENQIRKRYCSLLLKILLIRDGLTIADHA